MTHRKCNHDSIAILHACGEVAKAFSYQLPVAPVTKEANPRLAKRPLKTNGRLANRWKIPLAEEATGWYKNAV